MFESIAQSLLSIPPEIATFVLSMLPIGELRGAIPIAVGLYDLAPWPAYVAAVVGNMVPVFFILWLLDPLIKWLSGRSELLERFFDWLLEHTRKKVTKQIQLYGEIALVFFVAIPLPFTGAWTGALAAYLFKIPPRLAIPLIFVGILISGIIVTTVTVGIKALI